MANSEGYHVEYYVLVEGQRLRFPGVKEGSARAYWFGPALVTRDLSHRGLSDNEMWSDDPGAWEGLQNLARLGLAYLEENAGGEDFSLWTDEGKAKLAQFEPKVNK